MSVRHSISVDFTVPQLGEEFPSPFPIPLAFQRKWILRNFSLRDEHSDPLFLLQGEVTSALAKRSLVLFVHDELQRRGVSPAVLASATSINGVTRSIAELLESLPDIAGGEAEAILTALNVSDIRWNPPRVDEDLVLKMVQDFAYGFPILVPIPFEPGRRRLIKMTYDAALPRPARPPFFLPYSSQPLFSLELSQARLSESSYHLEVSGSL
jgi:hypothetical protein